MNYKKSVGSFLIPLFLLLALVALRIFFSDKVDSFSMRVFDHYQKLKPRAYQAAPVRFIDIDDESLAQIGQWPWPRTQIAQLLTKLSEAGAAVIVLDILFSEADRTSPLQVLPLWKADLPDLKTLQNQAHLLPDHDQVFADAIAKTNTVTGFTLTQAETQTTPSVKAGFAHSGEDPLAYLPIFRGAITNLPGFEAAAAGSGSFNFFASTDGVLRRVPMLFRYRDQLIPSLVAEAVRVAQGASSFVVKTSGGSGEVSFGAQTGITSIKIGQFVVPTDSRGKLWLYDSGKVKERYLSAAKILSGNFDPTLVQGNILFLGSSAAGLKDMRITPLNPVAAGTEVHVQLVEQILHQEFLSRPDWAYGAEVAFLVGLGLILILALPHLGAILSALLGVLAIAFAFSFSWYAFASKHWLFDPVTPSIAALIIYLVVSLMNYLRAETEKNQIRGAFGRYVSPALLEKISKNPEQLKLGGEIRPMTILFSDIRNFTTLAEQSSAEALTRFMNRYLTPMTDIILKNNGTIDKYIGDCIMAFWNAPMSDPNHAQHACEAALAMQSHLQTWNQTMQAEAKQTGTFFTPIRVGIGMNTGDCCVGNMGSTQRFDYSVLGDAVNLASRLESQAKFYGVDVIIGEETQLQAPRFATMEMDLIRVKGKTKPARVYALLGDSALKEKTSFKTLEALHQKMLAAYRQKNWVEAQKVLELLVRENALPLLLPLYQLYQSSVRFYQSHPLPSDWDGVNSLRE